MKKQSDEEHSNAEYSQLLFQSELSNLVANKELSSQIFYNLLENIINPKLKLSIKEEINLIAFGIYSMEEINEIKKSFIIDVPKVVFENVTKNWEIKQPEINKLKNNGKKLDDKIFINVQEKIDFIKAEEERKRKEEEERKRKEEEENRRKMEIKEQKREKAKLKLKKNQRR